MLLFNLLCNTHNIFVRHFNTSNVTIQQKWDYQQHRWWENFNTSNVTIQHHPLVLSEIYNHISIHLMLLFNCTNTGIFKLADNFNTSNVTIQLFPQDCSSDFWKISIHLMLLFNWKRKRLSLIDQNFNTSNVTIQLKSIVLPPPPPLFQYI